MKRRTTKATAVLIIDSPVGPHSDTRAIHDWLDELATLRAEHEDDAAAMKQIDQEEARAVGWLHGRDQLSGRGRGS